MQPSFSHPPLRWLRLSDFCLRSTPGCRTGNSDQLRMVSRLMVSHIRGWFTVTWFVRKGKENTFPGIPSTRCFNMKEIQWHPADKLKKKKEEFCTVQRRAEMRQSSLDFSLDILYPTKKVSFFKTPVFVGWGKRVTFQDRKKNTKIDFAEARINTTGLTWLSLQAVS